MFENIVEYVKKSMPRYRREQQKKELRVHFEQKRRILSKEVVAECSRQVVEQVENNKLYQDAQTVMIYYPIRNEISLLSLLQSPISQGKTFLLPVTHRNGIEVRQYQGEENMKKGKFGIPEPETDTYTGEIDIVLVPGVAFSRDNHRLGRGGGYYDRFLQQLAATKKIGVGYAFQLTEHLPHERHDVLMDEVIVAKCR